MELQYEYIKRRSEFGRQPLFSETKPTLLDSINPEKKEYKYYGLRNPVHQMSQNTKEQSEHEANTIRVETRNNGARHAEGGWPKDVNFEDEEATARYRRRWEREDTYVEAVLKLSPIMEHYIAQNNAIELYQTYFNKMAPTPKVEHSLVRKQNLFRDPNNRPITCIKWTMEPDAKAVVAYAHPVFQRPNPELVNPSFFVWDIDQPNEPICSMRPKSAFAWKINTGDKHPKLVLGGLTDGKVCWFDMRAGPDPMETCPAHAAHRDQVSDLMYIASRTNTEFFSISTDGQALWWDTRKLSESIDQMTMTLKVTPGEPANISNAIGGTCLQFEKSLPTRFLAGMETGTCVNVNRKGRTLGEIFSTQWDAHFGPVRRVERNPFIVKMFATCGDWTVRLWSEEIKTSCVITTWPARHYATDLSWSGQRVSGLMSVYTNGAFQYWDFLRNFTRPIVTMQVSENPLTRVECHEEGRLVLLGDTIGDLHLLSLSDNLVFSGPYDKSLMTQTFDRENMREHIMENRVKELKMKLKAEMEGGGKPTVNLAELEAEEMERVRQADADYRATVEAELRNVATSKM